MKKITLTTKLTNEERETIFNIAAVEETIIMDSTIPKDFRLAIKQGWTKLIEYSFKDGTVAGYKLEAPKGSISIRKATKSKRAMTEEQKTAAKLRMQNYHKNKKQH